MAEERAWTLGEEVGYQVRHERRLGPRTRIVVETEGTLTRQLLADPVLEGVGAVVLDEFHERSLHTDLALALLREVQNSVRPDLSIIVMSATLDAAPVAAFLGDCPIVRSEGRTHPVEITYQGDPRGTFPERVARAIVMEAASPESGDLLVFLPGADEIRRVERLLEGAPDCADFLVLPLHGSLSADEQDRALRPADRRKIVLSTNVAETSLTIPGVRTVIDGGLARVVRHDPVRGLDRLVLTRISRASAHQRAGRAGRVGPGRCVRLWSQREERGMADADEPEIARVDLAGPLLTVLAWGARPREFAWFQGPDEGAVQAGLALLGRLGAVEDDRITAIGKRLNDLPVHPRLGRMLLAAAEIGRTREGATLAALIEERDILARGDFLQDRSGPRLAASSERSDLLARLDLIERARTDGDAVRLGLDARAVARVKRTRDQLVRALRGRSAHSDGDEEDLLKLVLFAYPDRVVRRRAPGSPAGLMVGGRGVRLEASSVVREADFFVAVDPREDRRAGPLEAKVAIAGEVRVEWLEGLFPARLSRRHEVTFDEERGRAAARDLVLYEDLVLKETSGQVTRDEASEALQHYLRERVEAFVREQAASSAWLDRLHCLRGWLPEAGLPEFGPGDLAEVLGGACLGKTTLDEVRRVPLTPLLEGRLTHAQRRLLETEAPEALIVPSGQRIRLTYEPGRPPVLAVRLQELFGRHDTPTIAGGRVRVLLHLLGPNYRPVQITDDLASFWKGAYFQVRKDLRAHYPKHSWPEDPLTAKAEAKGKKRPT